MYLKARLNQHQEAIFASITSQETPLLFKTNRIPMNTRPKCQETSLGAKPQMRPSPPRHPSSSPSPVPIPYPLTHYLCPSSLGSRKLVFSCIKEKWVIDGRTDGWTDGRLDRSPYRDAWTHLRSDENKEGTGKTGGWME